MPLLLISLLIVLPFSACSSKPSTSLEVQAALREEIAKDGISLTWVKQENASAWDGLNESLTLTKRDVVVVNEFELHEFENTDLAQFAADHVSPDGDYFRWYTGTYWTSTTTEQLFTPHLFLSGKVIVIYYGADQTILDTFKKVLGPQFAGR